jgi:succinyl-diaminopimelate desuccinylase
MLAGADLVLRLRTGLLKKFSARDSLFEPDYSTIEPTKKEPNVPNINSIPGYDIFYMDMRILPRYPVKDVLAEAERIKKEIEKEYGVKAELSTVQSMESKGTDPASPIVTLLSKSVKALLGVETRPVGIGGGTVGAFLRNEGIDAVVWGRMDDCAHQPNEYCIIQNLLDNAKVMAAMAADP